MIGRFHVNDHRFICRGVAFSVHFHSFPVSVRNTQCEQPHLSSLQCSKRMLCVKKMSLCVTVAVS